MIIRQDEPIGRAVVGAIHAGDVAALRRLLDESPGLAHARIGGDPNVPPADRMTRTLLHVAADWPGHFPNGAAIVHALADAGADVNARFTGPHTETPLHWAASSDDVEVLDALLDRGADIEAPGAVIAGGTPLADAVAFGQWNAARRLVERGAQANLWQAAALGLMDRVERAFASGSAPEPHEITTAFWCACHGGRHRPAEYLLDRGADLDWIGFDGLTPLDAAVRKGAEDVVSWLRTRGARTAVEVRSAGA